MRCVVALACLVLLGCGKGSTPAATTSTPKPNADPIVAAREADEQAAFSFDAACASIEDAQKGTKALAPVAGGDAKEGLLDVAEMFDSAGATLADHNEPPPPIEAYRKESSERSTERQKAVTDALDALQELRDARGRIDNLSQTAPEEHVQALETIRGQADEAIDAVQDAIKRLGGKVPSEEDDQS